ncbi:MAG TPA: phosphoribosyltransferase family protein [bacterium]
MQSYNYAHRKGVKEISWDEFAVISRTLAEKIAERGVEAVVGIARAGLFPAAAVACALRSELHPVRVTRRINDQVMFQHPAWRVGVPAEVEGKVIAVVDEIANSGQTLALVAGRVGQRDAARVVTASLICHTWAQPMPEVVGLTSDALVIFPWDKQVYVAGHWQLHPELEAALKLQAGDENSL